MYVKKLVVMAAVLAFIQPGALSAHGNDRPYISVDGTYVVANPFGAVNGAEHMAADVFLVGQPIQFSVDTSVLSAPDQVYGWRWTRADKDVEIGATVTHVYDKPGSYVVSLESRAPADVRYKEVNKIAVTIVPRVGYVLPTVRVNAAQMSAGTMRYEVLTTHDKGVGVKQVDWTFGDGSKAEDEIVTHRYKGKHDFRLYPSVIITDNNDIQAYGLFQLERRDGRLTASDVPALPRTVAKSMVLSSRSTPHWQLALVVLIAGVVVLAARRTAYRRSR